MVLSRQWQFAMMLLVLAGCPGNLILAQPLPLALDGLDLVVMIDHSGSMWGLTEIVGHRKSDPYAHRITGVQHLFKRLLDDIEGNERTHQLSVIEFGDQAQVAISTLALEYKETPDWRLKYQLPFSRVDAKPLRNTNTASAFEIARVELDKMASAIPSSSRRRVLLLITDGRPAMPGREGRSQRERITKNLGAMRTQRAELWVLAIDAQLGYWDGKEERFWRGLTKDEQAVKAEPVMPKLPELFNNFADHWLGTKTKTIVDDSFFCPPYIRRLKLSVTLKNSGTRVQVLDPDGAVSMGKPGLKGDKNLYFEWQEPEPGEYRIQTGPDALIATRLELIPYELARVVPSGSVDPGEITPLRFELRNEDGNSIAEDPGYPISGSIVLTEPDGTELTLAAEPLAGGKVGMKAEWTPSRTGDWRVEPRAWMTMPDGQQVELFESLRTGSSNKVTVTDRLPLRLRPLKPKAKRGFRVLPGTKTAILTLALEDEEGNRIDAPGQWVQDPDTWLMAQMVDRRGLPIGEPVSLTITEQGRFEARVPLRVKWRRGLGSLIPAKVHLTISEAEERLGENRYLHSLVLPERLAANRIAANPLSWSRITVGMPLWLWLLFWLLVLLILFLLALWFFLRWLPNFQTARRDAALGQSLTLMFSMGNQKGGFSLPEFSLSGSALHKLDRRVVLSTADKDFRARKFRVRRKRVASRETITISYQWEKGSSSQAHKTFVIQARLGEEKMLDGLDGQIFKTKLIDKRA